MRIYTSERQKNHFNIYYVLSHSVVSDSLRLHRLPTTRLLVHGIFQVRTLEWVAISSSRMSPNPGVKLASLASPTFVGRFFILAPPEKLNTYYVGY